MNSGRLELGGLLWSHDSKKVLLRKSRGISGYGVMLCWKDSDNEANGAGSVA
jgi:hypothetical protein